jgi:hypothetical protein
VTDCELGEQDADPVTDDDVNASIRRSADRFVRAISTLSGEQWLHHPSAGAWNAAEVTEHVTIANRGIHRTLVKGLKALTTPTSVEDDEIPYLFYRGEEPPNVSAPTGTWTEIDAAVAQFTESVGELVAWNVSGGVDLQRCGAPHPVFGIFNARQWLLFAQAHVERHRAQLIDIAQTQ